MPKKRCFLRYSQVSGERSARSWLTSQSSTIAHTSSQGPSRKACSSALSLGAGTASSFDHSGRPPNNSPSQPTVPASSATCSVSDSCGVIFAYRRKAGPLRKRRRTPARLSGSAIAA